MCGIAGFIDSAGRRSANELETLVTRMADAIRHRGPDDHGAWADAPTGVALGHRRLSILDLSPAGHQPMHSASGRFVIVFNGEIYNFQPLRAELEKAGHSFRGHSDTEMMLAGFEQWGVEAALKRFVGMFAFALWDRREQTLQLARDRLGEKPLYYGWADRTLLFGSELKALRAHPDWRGELDRDALTLFMRHNYIPAPRSIYRNISKLTPGSFVTFNLRSLRPGSCPAPTAYWSFAAVATDGVANPFRGDDTEARTELTRLLRDSVAGQMIADVPLGAFLSGGVDSSTIVALMQSQSSRPVKTFTIGFHEAGYNEAEHAKAVARHLGTEHTELYVTPEETREVIPKLPAMYDEPFADSSQIPTFLVSQLARRHVTVSLSGDAGDELFGGYTRYPDAHRLWGQIGWLPQPLRGAMAAGIKAVPTRAWDRVVGLVPPVANNASFCGRPGDRLHKLAGVIATSKPDDIYLRMLTHWDERAFVIGAREPAPALTDSNDTRLDDFRNRMMALDTVTYLPDDILAKVDRAAMAVSLESRIPLLDHRVVEFAWRVPLAMKMRNGEGKWLLRQVLYQHVPSELIERPKMGFGVPIDAWLRGPLREWAEDLLSESRLRAEGLLAVEPIRQKWNAHASGLRNWQYHLWDVLMFQAWLRAN